MRASRSYACTASVYICETTSSGASVDSAISCTIFCESSVFMQGSLESVGNLGRRNLELKDMRCECANRTSQSVEPRGGSIGGTCKESLFDHTDSACTPNFSTGLSTEIVDNMSAIRPRRAQGY